MEKQKSIQQPGFGIDAFGNQVIDPTTNVKELSQLHKDWADDIRKADEKLRDYQARIVEERTKREVEHLKEINDLHVNYGKELDKERANVAESKAKVLESQLTIDRERATLSAQLLAKTVTDNAEKLRAELDLFKRENNDRLLRIEGSISTSTGKSVGAASTGDWIIRIGLFLLAIGGYILAFI